MQNLDFHTKKVAPVQYDHTNRHLGQHPETIVNNRHQAAEQRKLNDQIIQSRMPQKIQAKIDTAVNSGKIRPFKALCIKAISEAISDLGIKFRLGGSLAASLKGAGRVPRDIDIEAKNGIDCARIFKYLEGLNGNVYNLAGEDWLITVPTIKFLEVEGVIMGGATKIEFTNPNKNDVIAVDITNENHPNFNTKFQSPEERGVNNQYPNLPDGTVQTGRLVKRYELIANFLDRIIQKPYLTDDKEDKQQIKDLLNSKGHNSIRSLALYVRNKIIPIVSSSADKNMYLNKLVEILGFSNAEIVLFFQHYNNIDEMDIDNTIDEMDIDNTIDKMIE